MSETDLAEVWARSLAGLADIQLEAHQRAWLNLTRPLGLVENTALIATPNEFAKEQLETRLRTLVTHALSRELGRNIQLAVTVDPAVAAAAEPMLPAQPTGHRTERAGTIHMRRVTAITARRAPHRITGLPATHGEQRHLGPPDQTPPLASMIQRATSAQPAGPAGHLGRAARPIGRARSRRPPRSGRERRARRGTPTPGPRRRG